MLLTAIASLAVVAIFNVWADPYRLFGFFPESIWTSVKTRPSANIRQIKVLNAAKERYPALIMGNSRADIGFDPEHRFFAAYSRKTYNAAVPGAGIQQVRDDFALLADHAQLKKVLLAIDFQDFVLNANPIAARRPEPPIDLEHMRLARQLAAAFTLSGTADSVATLAASRDRYAAAMNADGLNPMRDYEAIALRDGYPSMFRQRLQETTARYDSARQGIFPPGATDSDEFAALRDIVSLARKKNIDLYIVTYPYHAQYYLLFAELGLWDDFGSWKRNVLETVERQSSLTPCDCRTELWDFSVISPTTTPSIASNQAHEASRWYWEAGHFKATLGSVVLDRLAAEARPSTPFGAQLAAPMIDPWLRGETEKLDEYRRQHPEEMTEVIEAVRHLGRRRERADPKPGSSMQGDSAERRSASDDSENNQGRPL